MDFTKQSAEQIYNLHRAIGDAGKFNTLYAPTKALVRLDGVFKPSIVQALEGKEDLLPKEAKPGRIVFVRSRSEKRDYVCVKAVQGWVAFEKFYVGKKRVMGALQFKNGFLSKNLEEPEKYFVRCPNS